MSQYNVIGKNVPRVDAAAKVNGTAIYCDDVYFRNTVYGKLVHSPFAHAKILSIDISAALALPGVVTVLLAKDIQGNRIANITYFFFISSFIEYLASTCQYTLLLSDSIEFIL